ncbi:hypothetical protein F4818DRAFT_413425 [Hypoxylon cercidicola]|nr:hypothetical protein F4818DRAFT_413425 [Hypoxylon cercidicola]
MDATTREYFSSLDVFGEDAEQSPTQNEVDALQSLVLGTLSSDEAAAVITRRAAAAADDFTMRLRRSLIYAVVNQTAVVLPLSQPAIVDLLKSIRASHSRDDAPARSRQVWADLDGWMVKLADSLQLYETAFLRAQDANGEAARNWGNAVAFAARLTATRDPILGDFIFFRECFGSIVRTLDASYSPQDPTTEPDIIAAARLFVLSTQVLRERCQAGVVVGDIQGKPAWSEGDKKLSLGRWEHWRRRWEVVAGDSQLTGEARKSAKEAVEAMQQ